MTKIIRTKFPGGSKHFNNDSKKVYEVRLSDCAKNPKQLDFRDCIKKRIIVCAGRRGGKTNGVSQGAVKRFLRPDLNRILYAAPTTDQVAAFWFNVTEILRPLIDAGIYSKNESSHTIEKKGSKQRIRAKTAWNADTLRGDYADCLILDEFQLMNEDTWELVGAPMLLDNNGDAIFIYTPPSLHSGKRFVSKANDPQHAAKMFKKAEHDIKTYGEDSRWATFRWTSKDNGYISSEAVDELAKDMSKISYRQEILAEDVDEAPGALWSRADIERNRWDENGEYEFIRIVVGVDPTGTSTGDEAGIVVCGRNGDEYATIADRSRHGSPYQWATAAVEAYKEFDADRMVAEANYGGEMVAHTIHTVDPNIPVEMVSATRGKAVRAEPIAALSEKGHDHHIGHFYKMEDELCLWCPGEKSPNRLDAKVWATTDLKEQPMRRPGDLGIS